MELRCASHSVVWACSRHPIDLGRAARGRPAQTGGRKLSSTLPFIRAARTTGRLRTLSRRVLCRVGHCTIALVQRWVQVYRSQHRNSTPSITGWCLRRACHFNQREIEKGIAHRAMPFCLRRNSLFLYDRFHQIARAIDIYSTKYCGEIS